MTAMLERLDGSITALIEAIRETSVPLDARWIDFEGVGAILGFSKTYVQTRVVVRPDFPRPLRLGDNGHPRWSAREVQEWAVKQRDAPLR